MASTSYAIKSTQAVASLTRHNARNFKFNFTDALLLPYIKSVTYSIEIDGEVFARHASRPPVGLIVEVVTDVPVNATVYISVDQVRASLHYSSCGSIHISTIMMPPM